MFSEICNALMLCQNMFKSLFPVQKLPNKANIDSKFIYRVVSSSNWDEFSSPNKTKQLPSDKEKDKEIYGNPQASCLGEQGPTSSNFCA